MKVKLVHATLPWSGHKNTICPQHLQNICFSVLSTSPALIQVGVESCPLCQEMQRQKQREAKAATKIHTATSALTQVWDSSPCALGPMWRSDMRSGKEIPTRWWLRHEDSYSEAAEGSVLAGVPSHNERSHDLPSICLSPKLQQLCFRAQGLFLHRATRWVSDSVDTKDGEAENHFSHQQPRPSELNRAETQTQEQALG